MSSTQHTGRLPVVPGVIHRFIPDWPTFYCVGSDGTCWGRMQAAKRSLTGPWYQKKTTLSTTCYPTVRLMRDGKSHLCMVHRLVARAFVGPCPKGQECRHIDGNRGNAAANNLCYGTRADNMADAKAHGTAPIGSRHGMSRLTESDVVEIRRRLGAGDTQQAISVAFGVSHGTIGDVAQLRTWFHMPWPDRPSFLDVDPRKNRNGPLLTEHEVIEIRKRLVAGEERQSIAREFGVSTTTIWCIRLMKTWSHLSWPGRPAEMAKRGPVGRRKRTVS